MLTTIIADSKPMEDKSLITEGGSKSPGQRLVRNSATSPISARSGDFLVGGGEMGKVLVAKDWDNSPLGPIEEWPQSLRITVGLCLASNFPLSVAWGPHRIQIYNDGFRQICGAKHPESMGQDFRECWLTAWPVIGEAFEQAQKGQTSFVENQRVFLDRQGYLEETFFTHSFSPIRDDTGNVGGLFHPVTETTGRMLSERRSCTLRDLTARSADATSVDEVCAAAAEALGNSRLDVPFGLLYLFENGQQEGRLAGSFGLTPDMLDAVDRGNPQIDLTRGWPIQAALDTGQPQIVQDIESRFGALRCGPYPEPVTRATVTPIAGLARDKWAGMLIAGVSSRLPLDEAYYDFYGQVTSFLATALAKARSAEEERHKAEMLAELDRAKSAFFSNVSHEFRTPLTLMLSPLEELLDRPEIRNGSFNEDLTLVHRNGLRLLKLVNTLLEFSRIEGGRAQPLYEPTDLSAFTSDLASAFRSAVERAGLQLVVDCVPLDERIYVDPEMWEKIVLNLISNAFKFTFSGRIAVRLRQTETHVELAVEDTGGGIEADQLPRIFERFHRIAGAPSRTHEGTGIGLALVKDLVLLHGGSIAAASEIGRGSQFTVRMPRSARHIPSRQKEGHDQSRLKAKSGVVQPFVDEALGWIATVPHPAEDRQLFAESKPAELSRPQSVCGHILLVDDNSDMREYLRRVLNKHFEVHCAADGLEALEYARKFDVDLVLTDVMMPRMDGFELLRELRADSRTKSIPIILLSARAGQEARVGGLEAGADDYLIKPFTIRELLARVGVHLNMARMRGETAGALREMNERHCQMIETASDAFVSMDDGGCVLVWNRQAEITFGWSRDEAIGRSVAELVGPIPPLKASMLEIERFFESGESGLLGKRTELPAVRRTGEALMIELTVWPVRTHDVLTFSAFMRDIGHQKQAEADLTAAKKSAEAADRAKSEFLSSMSHEIRTPMNAILGMADMLWESELSQSQRHYVEIFRRAGGNLLTLINNILDLSKIESGNLSLEEVDFCVAAVIEQVIEILTPKAESKSIRLHTQLAFPFASIVFGDPFRLQQILLNLIGNAIKFTDRGEVLLRVECHCADSRATLLFEVCDTGIGIPSDKLEAIFEDFEQGETSTTRRFGGTGLGLGISRRLVRRMHGEIHARSEMGKGSTFSFRVTLPIGTEQNISERVQLDDLDGKPVLIVDNNPTNRIILSEMCSAWGMRVTNCSSGAEAIESALTALDNRPFALALVDRLMPGMDGFETASQLRRLDSKTAIFIVSSDSQAGDVSRCRELGLAGHLMKPVRRAELLEQIARALTSRPQPSASSGAVPSTDLRINMTQHFRFLAAEDSEDNRFLLQAYCQGTPYELTFVENGARAVAAYQSETFDLIIMDVQMPVMDGLAATREIRRIESTNNAKRIPVLALTANALPEDVKRTREAGCDAHVTKPISKKNFLFALDQFLVRSSAPDKIIAQV